ncbi:MAG: hypothetical protein ACXV5L_02230, partial [Thermoanaerobaculia bacterium]
MKHWKQAIAPLALLTLAFSAPQTPVEPAAKQETVFAKAAAGRRDGFIVLLRLRYDLFARWKATGKWPDDAAANAALGGHVRYWDEQVRAGKA